MTDYATFQAAVDLVRGARLTPTHANIATAKVLLDRGAAPLDDLVDAAEEAGLRLSRDQMIGALARFARAGVRVTAPATPGPGRSRP
jgi:hypothetical protein